MMKKEKELLVAIASQKGGVGKSVFTVLLASVLHYRKGLRVAVVDCDSPQHSIALMRERDMESVMKNDDLKVNLYRQYERIRKPAYPVIKSDPEKAVEDLRRYMDEKGETFDIVLFDLPGTLRSCLLYTSFLIFYEKVFFIFGYGCCSLSLVYQRRCC